MTESEAAQQRIATLEEELAVMARQLAVLTRYVFGKRSEPEPLEGRRQTAPKEAARRANPPEGG